MKKELLQQSVQARVIPLKVLTLSIHRLRSVANGNALPALADVAADDLQKALLDSDEALREAIAQPTESKDADSRDALLLRNTLANVVSVAITMLFDSHREDVMREFSVAELTTVSKLSEGLGGTQVEAIYRKGFDLAAIQAKDAT